MSSTETLNKKARFWLWLRSPAVVVFVATFIVQLTVAWFWNSTYRIWNFDLAWQAQVVASYAQLQEPTVFMIGDGFKALGNHFSPILALAAPFYALFPNTFTLNAVMAFCFALSAGILAGCATRLKNATYGYVIGIGLGVSWGFLTASAAQFHEYALGAPFLAYSLAKFLEGKYLKSALVAGVLVFVKEDVGLLLIGLGIVMAIRARSWRPLLLSVWGGAWVFFTIKLLIPFISGEWDFTGYVSLDPGTLFTDIKFKLVLLLFLILQGGILALRSPLAYIVIPLLGARFFSAWGSFYLVGYHYDTLTIIIASFALLDALTRYEWKTWLRKLALVIPLLLTVVYLLAPVPGSSNSYLTRDYSKDQEVIAAYEGAFAAVPEGSIVAADNATVAGFIDRGYTTYFIRSVADRPAPDCLVNETEEILNAAGGVISSIDDYSEDFGVDYELTYDTPYVKVWCQA